MMQAELRIDGASFVLAHGEDLPALEARITSAAQSGPAFVAFSTAEGREVSALIGGRTPVTISVDTVVFRVQEPGDLALGYSDFFDY